MLDKIIEGRTDLVVDFLSQGHTPHTADSLGTSLISWCAYHGDVTAIRLLIERGEKLESLGNDLGLNSAAFHGHWKLCQFLIEGGADPNTPIEETGETPLHAALCKANRPDNHFVVEVLLSAGADPNAATIPGRESGGFMRDARTRGETPLHRAAAFANEMTIEKLINAGASLEARDSNGDSPLSWASWHLRPASVLRLLAYGDHEIHPDNVSTYDHGSGWMMPRGKPLHA